MSRNEIHITKRKDGKWQAKNPENDRASVTSEEKEKVMDRARVIARNQGLELIPHKEDGKISNPNSYGNDPNPPKDEKQ